MISLLFYILNISFKKFCIFLRKKKFIDRKGGISSKIWFMVEWDQLPFRSFTVIPLIQK